VESWTYLKRPLRADGPVEPAVAERVSAMLLEIERGGIDAIRRYSRELDGWDPPSFAIGDDEIRRAPDVVEPAFKAAFEQAMDGVRTFAELQRTTLVDIEWEPQPGVVVGQRQVPIERVGSYLPGGRYPLVSSPLMSVLVPKVAGVERVVTCTPPSPGGAGVDPSMIYAASACGADAIFAVGGVPALAGMAFGIEGMGPVDMICGAGNQFVAEAKRQLYGRVGIDLLAGPSEVAVICDETADPELVAADLLAQAEHGPNSPAFLITTDAGTGAAVLAEIERQLPLLRTHETAAAAWRDYGVAVLCATREEAVAVSDEIACEHLEVHTDDDAWYHAHLRNYGSLFLGPRATVAYSDKGMTGTNHTLPTRRSARYTGGLSVAKFLKTLTFQRLTSDDATLSIAPAVVHFDRMDRLHGHELTAAKRLERAGGTVPPEG
jgi:sulfopropanediol 3-dehydrogenase